MPTGPKGEKRPADVNARAVMIARIATGEERETAANAKPGRAKGGKRRAQSLTPEQRAEIARAAAMARWKKTS